MSGARSATIVHEGGMRLVASTGSGRRIVFGDDAGQGELSPFETVVVSLAACSAMDVVSITTKKRQQIDRYEVHVEGLQREEYPQILLRADIVHEVAGPFVEEAAVRRAIELSALKYCPVSASLSAGATEVHHRYRIHATGPVALEAEGEVVVTGPYRRPDVVDAV
jgi:putative redox protein